MKGGCDYSALAKVDAQLQELLNGKLDAIIDEKSSEAAAALLSKLKKRTPVGKAPTFDGPMIESVEIVPVVQTVKRKKKDGTFTEYNRTVKKKKFTYTRNGEIFQAYWVGYSGGTLRRAWRVSHEKTGDDHIITAENPEKYASYEEYGHRQTPGRYVPALGKRLKASWVNGKFMLRTSADEISEQYPKAVQKVVDEALKEAFRGK